jgi:hypothetical protein
MDKNNIKRRDAEEELPRLSPTAKRVDDLISP